jgi:DNA polymerase III alpha subunit (gram-positive type)
MKILGIDFETSGFSADKDVITEAGLVLYDTELRAPVRISGFLVKGGLITAEITRITGITQQAVDTYGYEPTTALKAITSFANQADYFMAHNAPFDKSFLEALDSSLANSKPWVDTRVDLPKEAYAKGKSASLKYLCCDHNIYYQAHRAVSDVLAMLQLLWQYDIGAVIKRSQIPNVTVRAQVSFDERILAKERSYYWFPELKQWRKNLKMNEVEEEKKSSPFPVILVETK